MLNKTIYIYIEEPQGRGTDGWIDGGMASTSAPSVKNNKMRQHLGWADVNILLQTGSTTTQTAAVIVFPKCDLDPCKKNANKQFLI